MFNEPFAQGCSLLHRRDPRARILLAVACAASFATLSHIYAACSGLALAILLLALGQPPWRLVGKRLAQVNIFVLFIWLTVPWSLPGEPLLSLEALTVTKQGVSLALLVTVKANAMLIMFIALVSSMNSATLAHALERLHCPEKLVFLLLFTYRYIHVIAQEWHTLHTAAKLRGFVFKTGRHGYATLGNLLGMVFVRSFDRSTRVYEAMLLRGFSGRFRSVTDFKATAADGIFMAAILCGLAGIVLYDIYSGFTHV